MPSSAVSPVLRAKPADGEPPSGIAPAPAEMPDMEAFPVPPDWIIKDPAENKRRILAMLEQGERDIAAGRGRDAEDVFREAEERIARVMAARSTR